jgi:hypothetical protein
MTSPAGVSTPYSTIAPFFPGNAPSWIPAEEAQRILAYQAYEDIYWNNPNTFAVVARGTNDNPIYVPSGRVIVETINRYVARNMDFRTVPDVGTPQEQAEANVALKALFDRERFWSKFAAAKRFGIIRGDWLFHITADPAKPQGSRITITSVDPGQFFPIYDPNNVDRIIGVDLAEQVQIGDRMYIKRLRYMKTETGRITSETLVVEIENWNGGTPENPATPKAVASDMSLPLVELPAEITAIPVYHIRNFEEPQNPYGSSELRGLERIITAVNQGISDEELTLALEGLGVYTTTAGTPIDENTGQEVPWRMGPGRVLELPDGTSMNRVNGTNTVGPYQDHLKYLDKKLDEGSTVSDVAKGTLDVALAESGIALALRFGPILDLAAEKDILIKDVLRQFAFDLRAWLKVFEGVNCDNILWDVYMGPKLPTDRSGEADKWINMYAQGIISLGTLHVMLRELGFDIPEGEMINMAQEQEQMAAVGGGNQPGEGDIGGDLQAEAGGATPAPEV